MSVSVSIPMFHSFTSICPPHYLVSKFKNEKILDIEEKHKLNTANPIVVTNYFNKLGFARNVGTYARRKHNISFIQIPQPGRIELWLSDNTIIQLRPNLRVPVHVFDDLVYLCTRTTHTECECIYTPTLTSALHFLNDYVVATHDDGSRMFYSPYLTQFQEYAIYDIILHEYKADLRQHSDFSFLDSCFKKDRVLTLRNSKKSIKTSIIALNELATTKNFVVSDLISAQKHLLSSIFLSSEESCFEIDLSSLLFLYDGIRDIPVIAQGGDGFFGIGGSTNPIVHGLDTSSQDIINKALASSEAITGLLTNVIGDGGISVKASLDEDTKSLFDKLLGFVSGLTDSVGGLFDLTKLGTNTPLRVGAMLLAFFGLKKFIECVVEGVVTPAVKSVLSFISGLCGTKPINADSSIVTQAGGDTPFFDWEAIVSTVVGSVYFFITGSSAKGLNFKDSMKFFSEVPKMSAGVTTLIEQLISVFSAAFTWVKNYILGESNIPMMKSYHPHVQAFYDESFTIMQLHDKKQFTVDLPNYDTLNRLHAQGLSLLIHGNYGPDRGAILSNVRLVLALIEKIRLPFIQSTLQAEFIRQEPLTILIRGAPGVGKSWLMKPLVGSLLAEIFGQTKDPRLAGLADPGALDANIYTRNSEQGYWDGYRGQFVTVFDDFGQCVDSVGNLDNEYMNVIRATNVFPYVLHMANLEAKGSTVFTSKVVICTTNNETFQNVQSIHHVEALIRRFDIIVDVGVNMAQDAAGEYIYAMKRPGCEDFKCKPQPGGLDIDAWTFNIMQNVTRASKGIVKKTMSYDPFVHECFSVYQEKTKDHSLLSGSCKKLLDEDISYFDEELEMFNIDDLGEVHIGLTPGASSSTDIPLQDIKGTTLKQSVNGDYHRHAHLQALKDYVVMHTVQGLQCGYDLIDVYLDVLFKDKNSLYNTLLVKMREVSAIQDFNKVFSRFGNLLEKIGSTIASTAKLLYEKYPLLSMVGIITSLFAAYKLMGMFFPKTVAESSPRLGKKKERRREGVKDKRSWTMYDYEAPLSQSGTPHTAQVIKKVENSYLHFSVDGYEKSGTILMVSGCIGLMPYHYFPEFAELVKRGVYDTHTSVTLNFGDDTVKECSLSEFAKSPRIKIDGKDLCLVKVPGLLRNFPNITKHIATRTRFNDIKQTKALVLVYDDDDSVLRKASVNVTFEAKTLNYKTLTGIDMISKAVYKYTLNTASGDCGSCAMSVDPKHIPDGSIFGLHVAAAGSGPTTTAYGVMFCREEVLDTIARFEDVTLAQGPNVTDHGSLVDTESPVDYFGKMFITLGKSSIQNGRSVASALRPIPGLFECLGPTDKVPAALVPGVYNGTNLDPLKVAIEKYSGTAAHVPKVLLMVAAGEYFASMLRNSKFEVEKLIISYENAISGMDGVAYFDAINRKTSPGFPWSNKQPRGENGKHYYLGSENDFGFDSPGGRELKKRVLEVISKARKGERSLHIYKDVLKDELRTKEKVAAGKTRLISAAPLDYVVAVRMYFLAFSRWIMLNRTENGVCVGVNPFSQDWDHIHARMDAKGDNIIAGDFSSWDCTMNPEIGDAIIDLVNRWYDDGEENCRIRKILFLEMYSSVHIFRDQIYAWLIGMPSGNPLTSIINSLYNNLIIRMSHILIKGELQAATEFDGEISMVAYGDDNIISVSDSIKEDFTLEALTEALAAFGLKYTDDKKVIGGTAFRSMKDITFLKRSFVYNEKINKWMCPLDIQSIRHQLYYARDEERMVDIVHSSAPGFFRELSLHGEAKFKEYYHVVAPLLLKHYNYVPQFAGTREYLELTLACQDECWY